MKREAGRLEPRIVEFFRRHSSTEIRPDDLQKLSGDASARQYFRYRTDREESFILTLYPEPFDPTQSAYRQVYELMRKIGVPVPSILSQDERLGVVLQQDLGDESLEELVLSAREEVRRRLLERACQHILSLQQNGPRVLGQQNQSLPSFSAEKFIWELRFFQKHYLIGYRRRKIAFRSKLDREFVDLCEKLTSLPKRICHRDYQVRNLMLHQDRVYVIDFQDTRWGPPTYDLASLLKDSIQLDHRETRRLITYFLCATDWEVEAQEFEHYLHLTCIQRLLKALGTYGYQISARNRRRYRKYVPGSLYRVLDSLCLISEYPRIRCLVEEEVESCRKVERPRFIEC